MDGKKTVSGKSVAESAREWVSKREREEGRRVNERTKERERQATPGKVAVSTPKLTTRILSSRAHAIFRYPPPPPRPVTIVLEGRACRFGITTYIVLPNNAILLPASTTNPAPLPSRLPLPVLSRRGRLSLFFRAGLFREDKRHHDWQLRRVRMARVISNKCHKIEKLNG